MNLCASRNINLWMDTNQRYLLMPLYEFYCPKCREAFEKLIFASDNEPVKCPKCGAAGAERILSVFSSACHDKRVCLNRRLAGRPAADFPEYHSMNQPVAEELCQVF
jgi:putative FmdB family regulatory protein